MRGQAQCVEAPEAVGPFSKALTEGLAVHPDDQDVRSAYAEELGQDVVGGILNNLQGFLHRGGGLDTLIKKDSRDVVRRKTQCSKMDCRRNTHRAAISWLCGGYRGRFYLLNAWLDPLLAIGRKSTSTPSS